MRVEGSCRQDGGPSFRVNEGRGGGEGGEGKDKRHVTKTYHDRTEEKTLKWL